LRSVLVGKVGIVLLNWNGLEDTLECINSLNMLSYTNYVIIVVDNNSDEDISPLEEKYSDVVVIKNKSNDGFAKGNNIGIKRASELGCDYIWILNNDTVVATDSLDELVKVMDADSKIGAVTNLIYYYDDKKLAWFAGGFIKNGTPGHLGYFKEIDLKTLSDETDYLSGCSFLARTEALNSVEGFDEKYFCYSEDVDISLRMKEIGYKLAFSKYAIVWHKVSKSAGKTHSPIKEYYKARNNIYFLNKNKYPKIYILKSSLYSLKFILSLLIKHRKPVTAKYIFIALLDAFRGNMGKKEIVVK